MSICEVVCDPQNEAFVKAYCFEFSYELSVRYRIKSLGQVKKTLWQFRFLPPFHPSSGGLQIKEREWWISQVRIPIGLKQ